MIKEFYNLTEIQKYYDEKTNTYIFREDGKAIDLVVFKFDLDVDANIRCNDIIAYDINTRDIEALDINAVDIKADNIHACNINAGNINARDIYALEITANNIEASDINYFAICCAYKNIICETIKGERENAKHFVLDGKLEILGQ